MSQSTTNNAYMEKSMNGIISIDDGAGTIIENGVVTCLELDVPRINVDQIESRTVGANVSMFTELVGGSIHLANGATTLFVDAPTTVSTVNITNLNATNISTNNIVSAAIGTVVNLFNNQSAGLTLGSNITFGALTIGGASQNGQINIRNTGTMNLGATSSIVNIGASQTALKTINIGNLGITYIKGSELNIYANMYVNTINASTSTSNANLFTNVSTGIINIGTSAYTTGTINIGKQSEINFSNSTLNIAGGANVSNLFCDNFRHEVYGTNVSLMLEEFGSGASIQMGNVSNRLIIYAPTTIVDSLKTQTIISPNPTILSDLFANNTSGNVSIATGLTTGILTLGSAGVVNIKGSSVNISTLNTSTLNVSAINTNTITATNTSSNAVIYNNITTGMIQMGNNAFLVEIGTNASTVSLGYNANAVEVCNLRMSGSEIRTIDSASALTIGGVNMSTTQIIAIGTSQENVYFGSTTATANMFVGDFRFNNDTMNLMIGSAPNMSGIMKIGDTLTTGSLQLATGLTTGNVSIGNGAMTGNINIRTTGSLLLANSASSIELGTGASVTNNINMGNVSTTFNINSSTINLSSRFLNIGAIAVTTNIGTQASTANNITLGNVSTNLNFNASTISIGTTVNSNAITIGNISTVQLGIKSPINPDYDTKYTAGASSGGTPTGCIGNFIFCTTNQATTALTNLANQVMCTFTDLPIGVWLLYWTQNFTVPTTNAGITYIRLMMGTTSGGNEILFNVVESATKTQTIGSTRTYSATQIFSNTVSTTDVYYSITASFAGTLTASINQFSTCRALRLA